jgi:Zn finger protein HypA/HybF involved in hydrogenase expression
VVGSLKFHTVALSKPNSRRRTLTKDDALKIALDELVYASSYCNTYDAIDAVKEALAQPEQEPVVGLQCANCHLTIELLNDKVMRLMQERNFCPRCGKLTTDIHTCTPPNK